MPSEAVIRRHACRRSLSSLALVAALVLVHQFAGANGADLPPQVVLQGFVKPQDRRLELVVRVPLVMLASFALPKRGPGYLDLARIEDHLPKVAAAAARQIELFEDGTRLSSTRSETRLALPSDRSFQSYATARAHFEEPTLPLHTDLYWNQGFLDVALEYPIKSPRADFSVRVNVAPELGQRVKLHLEFLPPGGPPRVYDLPGRSWRVALDPRWYDAAWTFARSGFVLPFSMDRLVLLVCLAAPFRQFRGLLAVVMALTVLQGASLTAGALGATPDARLLTPLFETCVAAVIVLLAIENVVAPSLRRRWFIACVVGVLSGFDFGHVLADDWQFAGAHAVLSAVSFNLGVALGDGVALALAFVALGIVFTYVTGERLGVVVLSVVLGHTAWHWMLDSGHGFEHAASGIVSTGSVAVVAWWMFLGLLAGGVAWFLPERFDAATPRTSGRALTSCVDRDA
jgi:HupE/UreJ protein